MGRERIDRVWIFPPRALRDRQSGLVVFSLHEDASPERRTVATLRLELPATGGTGPNPIAFVRQGTVPVGRAGSVVDGVLRRLGETEVPRLAQIGGDAGRWEALLAELAAPTV